MDADRDAVPDNIAATVDHNDISALEPLCHKPVVAYVCDGAYWTGGHLPIEELCRLQRSYGLFLYIDDSHGLSFAEAEAKGTRDLGFRKCLGIVQS